MDTREYPTRAEAEAFRARYLEGADAKAQALHDQLVAQGLEVKHERYPYRHEGTYRFEVMF